MARLNDHRQDTKSIEKKYNKLNKQYAKEFNKDKINIVKLMEISQEMGKIEIKLGGKTK